MQGTEGTHSLHELTLQARLGRGRFGEVYLGSLTTKVGGFPQQVAVKILRDDVEDDWQALERLRDEGRLLSELRHPAIVKVRDLCYVEGRVALITEYVPGADLSACIHHPTHALSPRASLTIIAELAAALDSAFNQPRADGSPLRLIHRDIKPGNVRIMQQGYVRLLDFGIAKADDPHRVTSETTQIVLGSLPYLAPEALQHDDEADTPARDVYALGCTLYEALTREPYAKGLRQGDLMLLAVSPDRFDALRASQIDQLASGSSPELADLVSAMLAYNPRHRPSAAEVEDACRELATTAPGPSLRRWCRSHDWPAVGGDEGRLTGRVIESTTMVEARDTSVTPPPLRAPPRFAPPEADSAPKTPSDAPPAAPPVEASAAPERSSDPRRIVFLLGLGGALAGVAFVALVLFAFLRGTDEAPLLVPPSRLVVDMDEPTTPAPPATPAVVADEVAPVGDELADDPRPVQVTPTPRPAPVRTLEPGRPTRRPDVATATEPADIGSRPVRIEPVATSVPEPRLTVTPQRAKAPPPRPPTPVPTVTPRRAKAPPPRPPTPVPEPATAGSNEEPLAPTVPGGVRHNLPKSFSVSAKQCDKPASHYVQIRAGRDRQLDAGCWDFLVNHTKSSKPTIERRTVKSGQTVVLDCVYRNKLVDCAR